jgi:arylsulfate sulfotransferase
LGTQDFSHANSVYPLDEGRSLLMSFRNIQRVIKIDVATGRVVWQLGKGLDFEWVGSEPLVDRWFWDQHDAQPLPNGHILMFDNGNGRESPCLPSDYSRALELELDEQQMTVRNVWEHRVPYAPAMGEVIRMPNGNTFIAGGWSGQLTETTADGEEVWVMRWDVVNMLPNLAGGAPILATWDYSSEF